LAAKQNKAKNLNLALFLLLILISPSARALEVVLTVTNDSKIARKSSPVRTGIPFAKGKIKDLDKLSVKLGSKTLPAQFTTLSKWPDGSMRWVLLETQVDLAPGAKAKLLLREGGGNSKPVKALKISQTPETITINTGPMTVVIDRKSGRIFKSVKLDGREMVSSSGRGMVLYLPGEKKIVETKVGRRTHKAVEYGKGQAVPAGPPDNVKIELQGPMRTTVCIKGTFPNIHNGLMRYTVRVTVWAGLKKIGLHAWLENHGGIGYWRKSRKVTKPVGKMEWFIFDACALELGLNLGNKVLAKCEGASSGEDLYVLQLCKRNRDNRKLKYNDYDVYSMKDYLFTITAGGKELKKGDRTDGLLKLTGNKGGLTAGIRDFWQNYEKAIGYKDNKLNFWLWPTEGTWPRIGPRYSAGLYDDQLKNSPRPGLYHLQGSVHKGHQLLLDFSGQDSAATHVELTRPLLALAPANYYAGTGAAPALFAPPETLTGEEDCDAKLKSWSNLTASLVDKKSRYSFFAARKQAEWSSISYFGDSTYWYGWMDFGDIAIPAHGPVGLHYDWLWLMTLNTMRTGNITYMRFATEMARHRIDIDQLWSDHDPDWVSGLQRSGGFPAFHAYRLSSPPGPGSNFLAGLVLYYMMTGEPKALEACHRNARGLKASWQEIAKRRPYNGPQGNMASNAWALQSYCAMYDLTADKKWVDEALALFKKNIKPKWKALGAHLHSPQQIRSQGYTKDDIKYCQAIYGLCMLHNRSGDADVLKLLQEGSDKEFSENYFDAPLFLADLKAYVGMVTGKSDYADDALEHWIEAWPESKSLPAFQPRNSIWSKRTALYLRAGHLLQYYYWKKKTTKR
jgi:PcRGLX-like protein central beta sandwich domain/PcRGLX-like N-terminal RIFT barrel domain